MSAVPVSPEIGLFPGRGQQLSQRAHQPLTVNTSQKEAAKFFNTRLAASHRTHLEKEMATPSNILAWRIPRAEEPGGLSYSP